MASEDEEGEILPDCVTNYVFEQFTDHEKEPVSFSSLPLQAEMNESVDSSKLQIFLRGTSDDGLQVVYKQVLAWKFELSFVQPEIYVLCKDKHWLKLQRPKKSFECMVRTILITIKCLHYVKRFPEESEESLWSHVSRSFSSYDVKPSEADILPHIALIRAAGNTDRDLAKSKFVAGVLSELPKTENTVHKDGRAATNFIVGDNDDLSDPDKSNDQEDDLFDTCCSICDNGGDILCCQGRCMRSFHPTSISGEGQCRSLGLTEAQVDAMPIFRCKNCEHQQHQCFICGELGSSDKSKYAGAEVFSCAAATCGRFYHPKCVAKAIHQENGTEARRLEDKIAAGESFACPSHKCCLCKLGENREVFYLQFAVCRRCPKAYHRKCLPRAISFESYPDRWIFQRAWDDLLPGRVLIYCLDHQIVPELGTPRRNHLKFPGITDSDKMKRRAPEQPSTNIRTLEKKRKLISGCPDMKGSRPVMAKPFDNVVNKGSHPVPKFRVDNLRLKAQAYCAKNQQMQARHSPAVSGHKSILGMKGVKLSDAKTEAQSMTFRNIKPKIKLKLKPQSSTSTVANFTSTITTPTVKASSPITIEESEIESGINALVDSMNTSFKTAGYMKEKSSLGKIITEGKVEAAVEAVRAALQELDTGGTTEDAMAICEPDILKQIKKWKDQLYSHLTPFIHGPRYSSHGRHFTKSEKLKEIVERLHWYVQTGDMIVDFCCGANEFSCLMKEKLESVGKKCSFRNFDLFPAKNDFNFEVRDWFTVGLNELPDGYRLIMGLNPPFGVNASKANQFINKALQFRPKLITLIVPEKTQRLDEKRSPYELIWEDRHLLSGKAFYLPGSVDVHDKQLEQWNHEAPPLYLWSRPDWASWHREIARTHGHIQERPTTVTEGASTRVPDYLMGGQYNFHRDYPGLHNEYYGGDDLARMLYDIPEMRLN